MARFQKLVSGLAFSHVLITRPQPEAAQLAALFDGSGLRPMVLPAFDFAPTTARLEPDEGSQTTGRHLAVFTSKRSVEFGLPQLPAGFLDDFEIAAIGPASAAALEQAGLTVSLVPDGGFTSESMLAHPTLARKPGRALIFAAPGGRDALQKGLGNLGWSVRLVHVYLRRPLRPDDSQVEALLAASGIISTWTSANAMRGLAANVPPAAWERIRKGFGVVTSERLQACLRALGLRRSVIAAGPDNESIHRAVLELI